MKIKFEYDMTTGRVTNQYSVPDDDTGGIYGSDIIQGECYVQSGVVHPVPPIPLVGAYVWDWSAKQWVVDIPTVRKIAKDIVDAVAGEVRKRYITSAPGQAETYIRKEEQARTWAAAGFVGTAPSFIAAEATALGVTAQSVAEDVIATADYWSNVKGPEIEACRRKWCVIIEEEEPDANVIMAKASLGQEELETL